MRFAVELVLGAIVGLAVGYAVYRGAMAIGDYLYEVLR